jgi:hypothetical protein
VVGNLWPLRDDEAAALASSFYRHLARGASVAEALARARRDLMADGRPTASWAGWVVMGDGSTVPFPGGRRAAWPSTWLLAAVVLPLLALGVLVWRRARRRTA